MAVSAPVYSERQRNRKPWPRPFAWLGLSHATPKFKYMPLVPLTAEGQLSPPLPTPPGAPEVGWR